MISYFIPISLLVLASFALGLLVGRLAWGSSTSTSAPSAQRSITGETEDGEATMPDAASGRTAQDLPVWRMKEVRTRHRDPETTPETDPDIIDLDEEIFEETLATTTADLID